MSSLTMAAMIAIPLMRRQGLRTRRLAIILCLLSDNNSVDGGSSGSEGVGDVVGDGVGDGDGSGDGGGDSCADCDER